jgi:hypothetical protein
MDKYLLIIDESIYLRYFYLHLARRANHINGRVRMNQSPEGRTTSWKAEELVTLFDITVDSVWIMSHCLRISGWCSGQSLRVTHCYSIIIKAVE